MVLGLILTELVSNSMKYAFKDGRDGKIRIALTLKEGRIHLDVSDNGIGFDASQASKGIGIRLVKSLTRQLGGELSLSGEGGLAFALDFPAEGVQGTQTSRLPLADEA